MSDAEQHGGERRRGNSRLRWDKETHAIVHEGTGRIAHLEAEVTRLNGIDATQSALIRSLEAEVAELQRGIAGACKVLDDAGVPTVSTLLETGEQEPVKLWNRIVWLRQEREMKNCPWYARWWHRRLRKLQNYAVQRVLDGIPGPGEATNNAYAAQLWFDSAWIRAMKHAPGLDHWRCPCSYETEEKP